MLATNKSKLGRPVRSYFISGILFLLFVQRTYQNIARISNISLVLFTKCMDGITEWCIKYVVSFKNNLKTASIFQIMCKCCVLKFTCEQLKTLLIFFHFVGVYL